MFLYDEKEQQLKGIVLNIEHFHINDGIGIRTNVFLKGCNLWCPWCCNPESQEKKPQMVIHPKLCQQCGRCEKACPHNAISANEDGTRRIDLSKCKLCGTCLSQCLASAIELYGKEMSVAEIMAEVEKDNAYYLQSGGGMTLSGGEPCLQPEFSQALVEACKKRYINIAVETAAAVPWNILWRVVENADELLVDVKFTNQEQFNMLSGEKPDLVKENIKKLREKGKYVKMRCPIIPTLNDNEDHINQLIGWAKELDISDIDILPFHQLGKHKYLALGYPYLLGNLKEMDKKAAGKIKDKIAEHGFNVIIGG